MSAVLGGGPRSSRLTSRRALGEPPPTRISEQRTARSRMHGGLDRPADSAVREAERKATSSAQGTSGHSSSRRVFDFPGPPGYALEERPESAEATPLNVPTAASSLAPLAPAREISATLWTPAPQRRARNPGSALSMSARGGGLHSALSSIDELLGSLPADADASRRGASEIYSGRSSRPEGEAAAVLRGAEAAEGPGDSVDLHALLSSRAARPLLSPTRRARGGRWVAESPRAAPVLEGSARSQWRGDGLDRPSAAGAAASRWLTERAPASDRSIAIEPLASGARNARTQPRVLQIDPTLPVGDERAEAAWALHVPAGEGATAGTGALPTLRHVTPGEQLAGERGSGQRQSPPALHAAIAIPDGDFRDGQGDRDLASGRLVTWRLPS